MWFMVQKAEKKTIVTLEKRRNTFANIFECICQKGMPLKNSLANSPATSNEYL